MDLYQENLAFEREMIDAGIDYYNQEKQKAAGRGQLSDTPPMATLTSAVLPILADAVRKFVAEAMKGRGGPRNTAAKYLQEFDPEVVALITLRSLLDALNKALTKHASDVGNKLKLEATLKTAFREEPELFRWLEKQFRTDHKRHHFTSFRDVAKARGFEAQWPYKDVVRVGVKCIDLAVQSTGLFRIQKSSRYKGNLKRYYMVVPTERLLSWLAQQDQRCAPLRPTHMPMLVEPKPWGPGTVGGYHLLSVDYHQEVPECSDTVFDALNHIQATPWRINKPVLEILEYCWEHDLSIGKVPHRVLEPLPLCPTCGASLEDGARHPCLDNDEVRREWRLAAHRVWNRRTSTIGRAINVVKAVSVARRVLRYDQIWFPHKMDFRGRAYPMPAFLQPQGTDYARALLEFATGKPIDDPVAAGWLMIHGANLWGYDKANLGDRVQWTIEHEARILSVGRDPLGDQWWHEADKPWQFLAFCLDYSRFKQHGYGYVSHLPISVDGSCNGLQHFSAMLRDKNGGQAVNLVPSDSPHDVYQEVADEVTNRLTLSDDPLAKQWLALGVTRATVKRSVMIVPYSGTRTACTDYIYEWIQEKHPDYFEEAFKAAIFLAPVVWSAIETVVVSSRLAMRWLRECTKVHSELNKPLYWTNPLGFEMKQFYPDWDGITVKTHLGERVVKLYIKDKALKKLVKHRQLNGISPNFVHSLDSCALYLTVLYGIDNGVNSWMMVHDCYGTHAADMDMLSKCLREAFVDIYTEHDPLQSFYEQIQAQVPDPSRIPPPPPKGDLDIKLVRQSDFFFA